MYRLSGESAASSPYPADYEAMNQAFPLLQALHANERTLGGQQMFAASAAYPLEQLSVTPYYMDQFDPPELGLWKLKIEGHIEVRVQSVPSLQGMSYNFSVRDGAIWRAADTKEVHDVVGILELMHNNFYEAAAQPKPLKEPRAFLTILGSIANRALARIS